MKIRNWIYALIALVIVLFGFNIYGTYTKHTIARPMPCLDPDVFLEQHQHAVLQIVVDGVLEKIPTDIGITETCHTALHTHDDTGTIHVEAQDLHAYTLGEFFNVWQRPIERTGYTLTTFVDGKKYNKLPQNIVLQDQQQLLLSYKRIRE